MNPRAIGGSGLASSALGLGCMGMSEFYGPTDDEQSLATLEHAFEHGIKLYDTADAYGAGHNEELVGRFARGKRDRIVIATKFGIVRQPGVYERRVDNSPAYIRSACDASLRRLKVEAIDLYYVHRLNLEQTPLEDSIGTLADLVKQGKIRAIGLSEVSPATLKRAAALHPIAAVQSEYSLWTRDPEQGVLAACRDVGAAFFAYSPLGRGFLTGRISGSEQLDSKDFRRANPRFARDNIEANLRIVEAVRALATEKGCTPAQLALAWLLAQGEDVIPIPGTKRIPYLEENLGSLRVALTADELRRIGAAVPEGAAAGERYTAEGMKGLAA
jgi:aryl-alcohol dehydrogenase-like predicted oxidoreductase